MAIGVRKIFYQLGKSVSTKFKFKEVYIQFIKEKQIGLVFKDDINERQEEKAIGDTSFSFVYCSISKLSLSTSPYCEAKTKFMSFFSKQL